MSGQPLNREHLKFVAERFDKAQRSFTQHNVFSNEISALFADKTDSLLAHLQPVMRILLQQFKKDESSERSTKFLVKIVANKKNGVEWAEDMSTRLVMYLLQYWNAKDKAVRFRVCNTLGCLLNELDENFEIDEEIWVDMEEKLLVRLRDKMPQVRRAACVALNRLQMPDFEDDKVIPALAHMMDHDSNKECRREALIRLDLNKDTLMKILRRIRDVNDVVRATAFKRLCQVDIGALSIYDRVIILKTGLKDRIETVRKACSELLKRRWLASVNNDYLQFLVLVDPENYESECELILKHVLSLNDRTTQHKEPPYTAEELRPEHIFYWRVLTDHYAALKDDEAIDRITPDIKDLCDILDRHKENEFVAWQLLKLALHLDFSDEFGRTELIGLGKIMMESTQVSVELIPFITKVLRRIMEEDDYMRMVGELVTEIRNPLDEEEPEEDEQQRLKFEHLLEELYSKRETLREEKIVAVRTEDFETAQLAKEAINELDGQIEATEMVLNSREKKDQATWKRVLTIVGNLLEFTRKSIRSTVGRTWLEPLLNSTLIPAVSHEDPFVREAGLLAFGLYCMLDKETARKNLILFLNVLQNDQLALQYLSFKLMFDFFMVFDLFAEEDPFKEVDIDEFSDAPGLTVPGNATKVLEVMKSFLNTEDHDMLACAVEGFTKLLFLNRLPIYQIDVLSRLFLLYFNVVTEQNEHIRQCLSMFFPLYASNKTPAGEGNRKTIARCLMPCLRAVAYAPKDSALTTVPINKLTEYFLWLLEADPLTNPNAEQTTVEATDTMSFHEQIAFDVLFEIEANCESTGVRILCRVLSILNIDKKNQHNIKQFKVLLGRITTKVVDKMGVKYLTKFRATLEVADNEPDIALGEAELEKLEEWRAEKVGTAMKELETWTRQQLEAGDDDEESPVKPNSQKRKRLMGRRHCELTNVNTGETTFGSPDKVNKLRTRNKRKKKHCESEQPSKKSRTNPPSVPPEEKENNDQQSEASTDNDDVPEPMPTHPPLPGRAQLHGADQSGTLGPADQSGLFVPESDDEPEPAPENAKKEKAAKPKENNSSLRLDRGDPENDSELQDLLEDVDD